MTDNYTEAQYQADTNAEIDFDDPMTAFYTGHRELTAAEYEECAAAHNADTAHAMERDRQEAAYAAWAQAHPAEHAAAVAAAETQWEAEPF